MSDIVVNKKTLGRYSQNEPVCDATLIADELAGRLREHIIEEVDGVDDDLVWIFGGVWTSL